MGSYISDGNAGQPGTQSSGGIVGSGGPATGNGAKYQGGSIASGYGGGGGGGYYGGGGGQATNSHIHGGGGGSGYTGGCVAGTNPITVAGSVGTYTGASLPGQWTDVKYVSGVGVGSAGTTSGVLPSGGGDGMVWIEALYCGAGYYLASGSMSCVMCPAGRYALGATMTCSACVAGRYSSVAGSSACTLCPAGEKDNYT